MMTERSSGISALLVSLAIDGVAEAFEVGSVDRHKQVDLWTREPRWLTDRRVDARKFRHLRPDQFQESGEVVAERFHATEQIQATLGDQCALKPQVRITRGGVLCRETS